VRVVDSLVYVENGEWRMEKNGEWGTTNNNSNIAPLADMAIAVDREPSSSSSLSSSFFSSSSFSSSSSSSSSTFEGLKKKVDTLSHAL